MAAAAPNPQASPTPATVRRTVRSASSGDDIRLPTRSRHQVRNPAAAATAPTHPIVRSKGSVFHTSAVTTRMSTTCSASASGPPASSCPTAARRTSPSRRGSWPATRATGASAAATIDAPRVALEQLESLIATRRQQHGVAAGLEHPADERPDHLVVFHDEHGFGAAHGGRELEPWPGRPGGFRHAGEVDLERRPVAGFAVHPDVAVALFHDAVHRSETEPGSFALLLGGEEGLEDVALRLGVHAGARVGNGRSEEHTSELQSP